MIMNIDSWKSQLRKGAAELAVLALLDQTPSSGIALVKRVEPHPHIGLSGGALYPLLNRLEREGKIAGRWSSETVGRPEKSYAVTEDGKAWLAAMREARTLFDQDMKAILEAQT